MFTQVAPTSPGFNRYTEDEIIAEAQGFDAVLGSSSAYFTRTRHRSAPDLRFISKIGIGVDLIHVVAASDMELLSPIRRSPPASSRSPNMPLRSCWPS